MSAFANRFATNKQAEEEGVEIDLGDGISVTVRRAKSAHVRAVSKVANKPYAHMRVIHSDIQQKIAVRVAAEGVLVDWSGVTDAEGKELPYTIDNAIKVFTEMPDFLDEVIDLSSNAETFRAKAFEERKKN